MKLQKQDIIKWMSYPVDKSILWTLSDGRAYTAIELANYVGVSTQEMLERLSEMMDADIIVFEKHRFLYYRIDNQDIADAVAALLDSEMRDKKKIYDPEIPLSELKYCRSCHNHPAGRIGRQLTERMLQKGFFTSRREGDKYVFLLTGVGVQFFSGLGIEVDGLKRRKGFFAKACLDFSERKHHLGGVLGVAFMEKMKEKDWIRRKSHSRVHLLTKEGKKVLNAELQIDFD